ncbi:Gfo/Idh/MocA family protein [Lacipirellula sp.]|uniref:Gfo/Idh/MocA family protein n=1 Tax=Lacipirellula sp. TaxID=2691419 RepID=UPI003D130353
MPLPELPADRRHFIKVAGAVSALGALRAPHVFAQAGANHQFQVALVGAGGRGTGAAVDALTASGYPIKLVAVADVFKQKADESLNALRQQFANKPELIDVPEERCFIGFDAYKNAIDALRPGDIAIFATPLAFRWVHYQYAIDKGVHVFMEKPLVSDGPTGKRMLELAKKADEKNLKTAVGLMVRHCRARQELHQRIQDGEIGDLVAMRAYRMHGPVGTCFSNAKPAERDELEWQVQNFHSFLWASGGLFSDFYIHQIDEVCWMKNKWPVKAQALGGRHYRGDAVDQNFDTYAVEYTFDDGTSFFFDGRTMLGCRNDMSSVVLGSKGSAIVSASGHHPGKCKTFKGHKLDRDSTVWAYPQPEANPYQLEWQDFIDAIVHDTPYNEVPRGIEASLVTSMGRMAAHTGQEVTYDQMLNCKHEMAPGVADFAQTKEAPLTPDDQGRYPVPNPGKIRGREYSDKA